MTLKQEYALTIICTLYYLLTNYQMFSIYNNNKSTIIIFYIIHLFYRINFFLIIVLSFLYELNDIFNFQGYSDYQVVLSIIK